jgi:hypothetical protein
VSDLVRKGPSLFEAHTNANAAQLGA